jgi:hypothetical protein
MNWDIDSVVSAIAGQGTVDSRESAIAISLFDEATGIGVGIDSRDSAILLLPGQTSLPAFQTKVLRFDPWCEAIAIGRDLNLDKVAVLRCHFDRTNSVLLQIVGGVFASLIDLERRIGDAGNAILVLRDIFAEGFEFEQDRNTLLGLIGELTVLAVAPNLELALSAWHSEGDDRYDFSWGSRRLEVKATTSTMREHQFNSRQLPALHGIEVWVASVQIAEVEVGTTIAEIFEELAADLPLDALKKLSSVIAKTAGLPPGLLQTPIFDLESTKRGVRLFVGDSVPTPLLVDGVSNLKWSALLPEESGQGVETLVDLLPQIDA